MEACNLIKSLVGILPTKNIKTEITLEDVINKLDSMEKNLPKLLNTSKIDESVVSINKRITVLEASNTLDSQNHRIDELEDPMETLSSTFSSV